ncbi:RNA-directed DNA polymerase, eukaryota, Reverse transcriptase zinc-binding domain protein [Thalictrum thalictroides]|uniref:RNA-directed DNA polymerase, eukaryota, Reverse transcriptase zinc-binding domain protein n=1 Tax=Thalictrum thalictroides TaxID=46969 RepID=A0A7J6X8W1_THATH|nr:RNA-directed DNA polymerase, eukaryota, Reverse transcriptase zinc-binding domain protein [Thalictrum thalictroides]
MTRIDRILINQPWSNMFPCCGAEFLPHGVSDHSPAKLIWHDFTKKAGPFRFSNAWYYLPGFTDLVTEVWDEPVYSDPMNTLIFKLVELKNRLKGWVKNNVTNLHRRVEEAKTDLYAVQELLQAQHFDVSLAEKEKQLLKKYGTLARAEYLTLRLKADCDWLSMGDRCTSFFHNAVKERRTRSAIWSLISAHGTSINSQQEIAHEFIEYYRSLMGADDNVTLNNLDLQLLEVRDCVTPAQATCLEANIEPDEIQRALFSMGDSKAPGPDGFNAFFFKACWPIVGNDFISALLNFFDKCSMPRRVNANEFY